MMFDCPIFFLYFQFFNSPKDASMWFANKEMMPEKLLSDMIGKNEKTKIIVKMTKSGSGAPCREPLIK